MVIIHLALKMIYAMNKMTDREVDSIFRGTKIELSWVCLLECKQIASDCSHSLHLTSGQVSLAPSLDLFLASRFFFLWRGLDSKIISSSSNVGSQFSLPFWYKRIQSYSLKHRCGFLVCLASVNSSNNEPAPQSHL